MVKGKEFEVGGGDGSWGVPKSDDFYNNWASETRFRVNDTIRNTIFLVLFSFLHQHDFFLRKQNNYSILIYGAW